MPEAAVNGTFRESAGLSEGSPAGPEGSGVPAKGSVDWVFNGGQPGSGEAPQAQPQEETDPGTQVEAYVQKEAQSKAKPDFTGESRRPSGNSPRVKEKAVWDTLRLKTLLAGFMAGVLFTVGVGAASILGYTRLDSQKVRSVRDAGPRWQENAPAWYGDAEAGISLPGQDSAAIANTAGGTGTADLTSSGSSLPAAQAAVSGTKLSAADVAETVGPSVVGISSQLSNGTSSGSGIIFSSDGYIVTNAHVISGGTNIQVTTSDGKIYNASVIGSDAKSDLAVLKIDASGLAAATFGDSDSLRAGDTAIAIGNPLGLDLAGTVTAGVISALNREVEVDGRYMTLLQTDAAINPGNSGGALANSYGQVIGINSVKIASSETEGLGFAIPSNAAVPIIRELMSKGYVAGRASIGISGDEISSRMASYYGVPQGFLVRYVAPGSGAEAGGLKAGDIITAFNGVSITTQAQLNRQLDQCKAGDTAEISVYRTTTGQNGSLSIVLSEAVS